MWMSCRKEAQHNYVPYHIRRLSYVQETNEKKSFLFIINVYTRREKYGSWEKVQITKIFKIY